MKSTIYKAFLLCWCLTATALSAQTLRSSYFLERMPMRHQLNPALMGDYGYVSIPVLGNLSINTQSNFSLSDVIYTGANDRLVTFMDPSVGSSHFLNKMHNKNEIGFDLNLPIVSFGFFKWGGYNTFDLGVKSYSAFTLPYDLFAFLKNGADDANGSSYRIRDLRLQSTNYAEWALGHARPIDDKLTLGAKVKFLFGLGNIRANIDQMDITMSENRWEIVSRGRLDASVAGMAFDLNRDGEIDGFDYDGFGLSGFGMGLDLGGTYQLMDELTLSASLTDIGFIRWNKNLRGSTHSDPFVFEGFDNIDIDDSDSDKSFENQLDDLKDDLENLFRFYEDKKPSGRATALRATLNVAGEYSILDHKISFGLLSTTRFGSPKVWTNLMASANFRPAKWFNAALTGSVSNFGAGWGWVLNLCPRGFNFFIGSDFMINRVTPQFVPVNNANLSFNMGINIPLGSNPFN